MDMRSAPTIGSKYSETADLDIAQVAKLIRKDLNAAKKDVDSPIPADAKIRVHISRYSMGQSIDVTVILPRPARELVNRDYDGQWGFTAEASAVNTAAAAIVQSYNRDNSDSMTDYYENKFFGHAETRGTD